MNTQKLYRTIVRIVSTEDAARKNTIEVVVPSWNPHKIISIPITTIPSHLRNNLQQNTRFFALVNVTADRAEDLRFEQFELAPEPDEDDGLSQNKISKNILEAKLKFIK